MTTSRRFHWLVAMTLPGLAACESTATAPKATGGAAALQTETAPLQPSTASGTPQTTAPLSETAGEGSASDRPSLAEPMGRGFQGALVLRLKSAAQSYDLRYLTRGNAARLQIDALEPSPNAPAAERGKHFDALIWDESMSLIDHKARTATTWPLDSVPERPDPQGKVDEIKIDKTGERTTLHGVICERYAITEGPRRIEACVSALPGTFDVDKFEALSRIDVPGWIERLLGDELLPLQAVVRDDRGRELHSFELVEYSAGPVEDAQLTLPSNYRVTRGAAER